MSINLYEKLFTEDLFTAIEYSTIIPPIYIYLISLAYITLVLTLFRYRRRLGAEYLPLQYLIFGLAAFTMGQIHNPMLEDQYSYLTASESLFWDRPLYVWLTFYLRYYGTLLFNLVLFGAIIYVTRRLCREKNIDEDLPLLFLLASPFSLFHVYWVLPEVVVAFLAITLYYAYTQGWGKIAFFLNIPIAFLKVSSMLVALPINILFLRKKNPTPILGMLLSISLYLSLKHTFLGDPFQVYNPAVTDISPGGLAINILNSLGNLTLILSPLVFFLPTYVKKLARWTEHEVLIGVLTVLLFLGVASNYDYYWRYFYPLLPFYSLKATELIKNKQRLFTALLFINFVLIFPILAVWNCPYNLKIMGLTLCEIRGF